jgi:hypothetical protein
MYRFKCNGQVSITVKTDRYDARQSILDITMDHQCQHIKYYDVSMPEDAVKYIIDHIQLPPGLLATEVTKRWKHITRAQVYSAWTRNVQHLWKIEEDPLHSGRKLLGQWSNEVDLFDLQLPDGVIALGWGIRSIANRIKHLVIEVALDATCACVPIYN